MAEKTLLKEENAQLADTVQWMTEHAEHEVYKEKFKAYSTLEGALENYRMEYHAAVSEHRHQCQLEVSAHQSQLAQEGLLDKQRAEHVYQHACDQANRANSRVLMLTNLDFHMSIS